MEEIFMKVTLQFKMIAFFLLVVLASAVGSAYTFFRIGQTVAQISFVDQNDMVRLVEAGKLTANAIESVAGARGYMQMGGQKFLDEYTKVTKENDKIEQELISMARTEEGRKLATEIKELDEKFGDIFEKRVVPLKQSGKDQEAVAIQVNEMAPLAQKLIEKTKEYQAFVQKQTSASLHAGAVAAGQAQTAAVMSSVIGALLGILIGFFAARSITKPIRKMVAFCEETANGDLREIKRDYTSKDEIGQLADALVRMRDNLRGLIKQVGGTTDQVAASSEELTASAEQSAQAVNQIAQVIVEVAGGAEKQLKAVDHTSSVVGQMSAGVQQIAANASTVAGTSAKTADAAKEGGKAVEKAISQMGHIEETVSRSAAVVSKLGERSKEIGQIVDTISGIAGQTNLLALNAAIEAARAGEQGRGFAVVAEEVRKLAEQSQEAAKMIASLIAEIQKDTDSAVVAMTEGTKEVRLGTEVVNNAGKSFHEISGLVGDVANQVSEISAAIEELASGSQQIVTAVREIDIVSKGAVSQTQTVSAATEEQSATMEEIASSSQALAKMAEELTQAVSKFRV
jgi:methyl-accepting chemotaxis protein